MYLNRFWCGRYRKYIEKNIYILHLLFTSLLTKTMSSKTNKKKKSGPPNSLEQLMENIPPIDIPTELPTVSQIINSPPVSCSDLMIDNLYTVAEPESVDGVLVEEIPPTELLCPIHDVALLFKISPGGWEYYTCEEEGCPMWFAAEDAKAIITEWYIQVKQNLTSYDCYCGEPFKIGLCSNNNNGNLGRLYFACRQTPQCSFFSWGAKKTKTNQP